MAFHNLHLMTVAQTHDIEYYGIQQVVSGLPGDTSFGSAMTALDKGHRLQVQERGKVLLRGWAVCLSADFPAAALCCGFKQSVSAACFCRECDLNQNSKSYPQPCSFVEDNNDLLCDLCLRDHRQMQEDYHAFLLLRTQKERDDFMAARGVNSYDAHAFMRVPHFDICTMVPYDFMHVELEGSLKNELAAMLYIFLRQRKQWNFTLQRLNAAIRDYAWPNGARPPDFTEGYLEKGTSEGDAKTGTHVHMTAGDMLRFAVHSIDVMLPLIKDPKDAFWVCWVTHVKYLRILLQHKITYAEVIELDRLIYEHHTLFLKCHGERMFKPKNHFAVHFPTDICNHGPVRHYWCMRFEALNQVFKNLAKGGAFRNTCGRCSEMWSIRSAMERRFGTKSDWGATKALDSSPQNVYVRRDALTHLDAVEAKIVQQLLLLGKKAIVEWISILHFKGSEVVAGQSWISANYDGRAVLAFIPKQGIFKYKDAFYFFLQIYPASKTDQYGLQSVRVPSGYVVEEKVILVDSPKLKDIVIMWMSHRMQKSKTIDIRFAPLQ